MSDFCTKNSKYFCHNSWPSQLNCAELRYQGGVRTNPLPHLTVPAKSPHLIGLSGVIHCKQDRLSNSNFSFEMKNMFILYSVVIITFFISNSKACYGALRDSPPHFRGDKNGQISQLDTNAFEVCIQGVKSLWGAVNDRRRNTWKYSASGRIPKPKPNVEFLKIMIHLQL